LRLEWLPRSSLSSGAGSEIVRVFVTVTDRDGHLVTNLVQNDFEARDDGKPQPIGVFDNSPKPIELITLLDVSGSMQGISRCCAPPPSSCSSGSVPTIPRAWVRLAAPSTSARSSQHDVSALMSSLPREIAPERADTTLDRRRRSDESLQG
jgi:hypothetical protein